MIIRSAYWVGAPRRGAEQAFRDLVEQALLPAMRRFPGVRAVHGLWPTRFEDAPPAIALQVLVVFDSPADAQRMLDSEERKALRPRVREAAGLFEGRLSHIDFETLPDPGEE